MANQCEQQELGAARLGLGQGQGRQIRTVSLLSTPELCVKVIIPLQVGISMYSNVSLEQLEKTLI